MHVMIPFGSTDSQAARHVLRELTLPSLTRLMQRLSPAGRDETDAATLSPPHERVLAAACGWPVVDGLLPLAARAAAANGLTVGDAAWGLLTPAHWIAGRDQVTMADPQLLALGEAESRTFFEAIRHLFESEGLRMAWGAPLRWYVVHPSLGETPCASLDRVIGRGIDAWLPQLPQTRLLRRLQSETQLVLYTHPLNEAREARGEPVVNSFWLSGCGPARPCSGDSIDTLDGLRAPMLQQDWVAWADAWQALDAGPIASLLKRCSAGEPITLTLCGERAAQSYATRKRSTWQRVTGRWRTPALCEVLEGL